MAGSQIQDHWSPLSFIKRVGGDDGQKPPGAPAYLPLTDQRRLAAYEVLSAFMANTRRSYLGDAKTAPIRRDADGAPMLASPEGQEFREYGDAMLLVEVLRDLVLGDGQSVIVGDPTLDPGEDPDVAVREWVQDWLTRERLEQKLLRSEENSCGRGDGVIAIGLSDRAKRPKVRVYDPGFYFPDTEASVDGWDDDDFPPIVHMLWEYEDADRKVWVRRVTWAMQRLERPVSVPWGGSREWTCTYTEVEWPRDRLDGNATVYSETMGKSKRDERIVVDVQDLKVDFIPVVHIPNTAEEWGRSIITLAAQLLDDIQSEDSDLALSAQTANPLLVTDAAQPLTLTGMPGETASLPAGAQAQYISASLVGGLQYLDTLMKRLAQNTRLGEVLLGRVTPAQVPSGYAMALGFHPARQVMRNARVIREEKYPLVVKFALRLAQAHGWLDAGPTPDLEIQFGSSLPSDLETTVTVVKELRAAGALSTETAVALLIEAGVPIDDAQSEVERLLSEDYEAMVQIVDAAGTPGLQEVLRRLGIGQTVTVPTPPVDGTP